MQFKTLLSSRTFCCIAITKLLLLNTLAFGQISDKLKEGLIFYSDSTMFIKLNMATQVWARYNENNPGTIVQGKPQKETTDLSIRRMRLVLSGKLTNRVSFFVQMGQNNLNYLSPRKTGFFFHDVTADYRILKKALTIGAGLNGWNGPSRFSNTSIVSILVLDPPAYQEVTNDTYDQFVRRLGIYAKGKIGKLDYRLSAGKPFVIQTASNIEPLNTNASFNTLPPKNVYQGYFMYQFLDQESNFGPGLAGNYLGTKRVFNIGAGFNYQHNGMYRLASPAGTDTIQQDIKLFAADVFYDAPVNKEKGTAYSLYACYSNYNYGHNFIKVAGPDNPASGSSTGSPLFFNKSNYGNAFPYLGSGSIYYLQTGYKFRNNLIGDYGTLQVYADGQLSDYDRLKSGMFVFDVGVNWLIAGQHSKLTLNYQNRPYFFADVNGDVKKAGSRRSEVVLQYQVAF